MVDPWQRLPGAFLLRLPEPENSQTGHDGLQTGGERRQSKIISRASLQQRNRESITYVLATIPNLFSFIVGTYLLHCSYCTGH